MFFKESFSDLLNARCLLEVLQCDPYQQAKTCQVIAFSHSTIFADM
jgi:hypothetical protein